MLIMETLVRLKSTTDDGDDTGSTICGVYAVGNISIGVCSVETEFKESGQSVKNEGSTNGYMVLVIT